MLEIIGLIGGACFAYCGVPAALATWKAKASVGTPVSVAWFITLGSIIMYYYLYAKYGFNLVLALNYSVEIISWGLIIWYHYFGITSKLAEGKTKG